MRVSTCEAVKVPEASISWRRSTPWNNWYAACRRGMDFRASTGRGADRICESRTSVPDQGFNLGCDWR